MAVRAHHVVEGDFENDHRFHRAHSCRSLRCVCSRKYSEARDLRIGQAGVGLANDSSAYRHRGRQRCNRSACRPACHGRIQPLSQLHRAWPARASASAMPVRAAPADRGLPRLQHHPFVSARSRIDIGLLQLLSAAEFAPQARAPGVQRGPAPAIPAPPRTSDCSVRLGNWQADGRPTLVCGCCRANHSSRARRRSRQRLLEHRSSPPHRVDRMP